MSSILVVLLFLWVLFVTWQTRSSTFLYLISKGSYEFNIPEDLGIGKPGGRVKANDRDIGENAKSTYTIIGGDERDVFEIVTDAQTQEGILRLKKVRPEKEA